MKFKLPEDLYGVMDGSAQHFFPATIIGPDSRLVFWVFAHQEFRAILEASAGILLLVPVQGADSGQEPAAFFLIRKDLVVQVFGVPVYQHAAEVEYQGLNLAH